MRDTLNERSDRLAHLEDRRPPNPNMPRDTRELKAIPSVVQHEPAFNQPDASGIPAGAQTGSATEAQLVSDRVKEALFSHDGPRPKIEVTSHGGAVTLKGFVSSQAEKQSLEEAALKVKGVTSIENQLIVEP